MDNCNVIGIDLAKNVFQVHINDRNGKTLLNKQIKRDKLLEFFVKQPTSLVGMEACGGAHYWAKKIQSLGHKVKIMSAKKVKPFASSQKNDANDAMAIAEAAARDSVPAIPVKSNEILELQFLVRIRARYIKQRTAVINQIRGFLMELGIIMPQTRDKLVSLVPSIIEDPENGLGSIFRDHLNELLVEIYNLTKSIKRMDLEFQVITKTNSTAKQFQSLRGIGPLGAIIMMIELCDPSVFENGRHFSAFLGLVPRQHSSGGKTRLGRISKQGDRYVRQILIHGARAVVTHCSNKDDRLSRWANNLRLTKGMNIASVALANKTARMLWAVASGKTEQSHVV